MVARRAGLARLVNGAPQQRLVIQLAIRFQHRSPLCLWFLQPVREVAKLQGRDGNRLPKAKSPAHRSFSQRLKFQHRLANLGRSPRSHATPPSQSRASASPHFAKTPNLPTRCVGCTPSLSVKSQPIGILAACPNSGLNLVKQTANRRANRRIWGKVCIGQFDCHARPIIGTLPAAY